MFLIIGMIRQKQSPCGTVGSVYRYFSIGYARTGGKLRPFRRSVSDVLARLLIVSLLALGAAGVLTASALAAGSEVYVEGTKTTSCGAACKSAVHDMIVTQSEGRTSGVEWCMNSYLGKGGETDPGFGTHCQKVGKNKQLFEGEYPPNQATSQTWVKSTGWIWGWAEWG